MYAYPRPVESAFREAPEPTLRVYLCETHDHKPLIQCCNLSGYDAELTPAKARALAAALLTAADDSELHAPQVAKRGKLHRSYPL